MEKGITHVALDDSKQSLVVGILRPSDTEAELREIPNEPRHLRRLCNRLPRGGPIAACYEAGPSGYDLYRRLTALGVRCQVMAPALTPLKPGERIKTNPPGRRQAGPLFRAGELTPIRVPEEGQEAVRDLRGLYNEREMAVLATELAEADIRLAEVRYEKAKVAYTIREGDRVDVVAGQRGLIEARLRFMEAENKIFVLESRIACLLGEPYEFPRHRSEGFRDASGR